MSAPSSWELAQRLYDKNTELENKRRRSIQAKVPSDPNTWQLMRENYEAIILEDHTFSEQHNVEYALWQLHYRRIEEFRAHFNSAAASAGSVPPRSAKGPRPDRVTKIRLQFKTFLSEATGFYHDLILKIKAKHGLSLGHFSDDFENRVAFEKDEKKSIEMKKGLISCHRCLIYLGDLARYKGLYGEGDSKNRDYAAASSYYLQAASLLPSSGNPHHQLAIVAAYSGDEVVAVYRYFRSLAVDNPFSTARENLIVAFEKNRKSYSQLHKDMIKESADQTNNRAIGTNETSLQAKEFNVDGSGERAPNKHDIYKTFCIRFVRLNGILFTRTSLDTFGEVLSLVSSLLRELLSSGPEEELNFGLDAVDNGLLIVRMVSILIFTVHNVKREAEGQSYADILQRKGLLQNAVVATFELMGHIFKRCSELSDPSTSHLLPGLLIFLEWLASFADVAAGSDIDDKQASVRSQFWDYCVSFLNKLSTNGLMLTSDGDDENCFFNMSKYEEGESDNRLALWEDFELRGFLPLQSAHLILDFSRKQSIGRDSKKEKDSRLKRILAAGKALTNLVKVDQKPLSFNVKLQRFVIGVAPPNLEDTSSALYSAGSKPGVSIKESSKDSMTDLTISQSEFQLYDGDEDDEVILFKPTLSEKRQDAISESVPPRETGNGQNAFADDSQLYGAPISAFEVGLHQKSNFSSGSQTPMHVTAFSSGRQSPLPVPSFVSQQMRPSQINSSSRNQHDFLAKDLEGWSLVESGRAIDLRMQNDVKVSNVASLSLPMQQFVNPIPSYTGIYSHAMAPGTMMQKQINTGASSWAPHAPNNFEFVASSGFNGGIFAPTVSPALPAASIKGPANRPVRHLGPPPGFNSVRPKQVYEPSVPVMSGENQSMDNYSWLDGYTHPSSMGHSSLKQYTGHPSPPGFLYSDGSNAPLDAACFPFPGKQVSTAQFEAEDRNGQVAESINLPNEQKQQHQSLPPPQQYQGKSFLMNHHIV
ncbi:hypothetical protein AgCh_019193 [Apium graveolens]